MRHAQIVTFGLETRLFERVRRWTETHGVWLRPTKEPRACLNTLGKAGSGVVVLRLGRNLETELQLLERISSLFPDVVTIVVGMGEHPALANLAWDLGARCVFLPLGSATELEQVLTAYLPGGGSA